MLIVQFVTIESKILMQIYFCVCLSFENINFDRNLTENNKYSNQTVTINYKWPTIMTDIVKNSKKIIYMNLQHARF